MMSDNSAYNRVEKMLQSLLDLNGEIPEGCIVWSYYEELIQLVVLMAEASAAIEYSTEE